MALIDTAQDALDNVTLASDGIDSVGATLVELAADERGRKKLVVLLLLAILVVLGFIAWKKSQSTEAEGETV